MSTTEIITWFFIVLTVVKLISYFLNPKGMWKSGIAMMTKGRYVFLVLAGVVLYYLIEAGFTIVDIIAVSAFTGLLIGFGMTPYAEMFAKKVKPENIIRDNWLYVVVWVALLMWAVVTLV